MSGNRTKLLKKILKCLIPYWELAEGFLLIVEENENKKVIDGLYEMISREINNINNEKDREKINKILKNIKKTEKEENDKENEYLENLINNI